MLLQMDLGNVAYSGDFFAETTVPFYIHIVEFFSMSLPIFPLGVPEGGRHSGLMAGTTQDVLFLSLEER